MTTNTTMVAHTPLRRAFTKARSLGGILLGAMQEAVALLRAHRSLRRSESQLMALDDRALNDIGIHRSEIRSVLRDRERQRRNADQPSPGNAPVAPVAPTEDQRRVMKIAA